MTNSSFKSRIWLKLLASITVVTVMGVIAIPTIKAIGKGNAYFPEWSPDGKSIIYYKWVDDDGERTTSLYTIDADGGNEQRLTDNNFGFAGIPTYSKDGEKIYFSDNRKIYVMNSDMTGKKVLAESSNHLYFAPQISPDGEYILFDILMDKENGKVLKMRSDGSDLEILIHMPSGRPSFSPDGKKITFMSNTSGQIYIANADGTNSKMLTEETHENFDPYFTPDGQYIVYNKIIDEDTIDIYSVAVDGSDEKMMFETPGKVYGSHISHNGKLVTFAAETILGSAIYTANIDGSQMKKITGMMKD